MNKKELIETIKYHLTGMAREFGHRKEPQEASLLKIGEDGEDKSTHITISNLIEELKDHLE